MNSESFFPIFFFAVFALIVGSFLYKMLKHGSFKAAMFGAPIERTVEKRGQIYFRLMIMWVY